MAFGGGQRHEWMYRSPTNKQSTALAVPQEGVITKDKAARSILVDACRVRLRKARHMAGWLGSLAQVIRTYMRSPPRPPLGVH